jgi:hypothetical protein
VPRLRLKDEKPLLDEVNLHLLNVLAADPAPRSRTRTPGSARHACCCWVTRAPRTSDCSFHLHRTACDWRFGVGTVVLAAGVVVGSVVASSFRQSYCPGHLLGRVSAADQPPPGVSFFDRTERTLAPNAASTLPSRDG